VERPKRKLRCNSAHLQIAAAKCAVDTGAVEECQRCYAVILEKLIEQRHVNRDGRIVVTEPQLLPDSIFRRREEIACLSERSVRRVVSVGIGCDRCVRSGFGNYVAVNLRSVVNIVGDRRSGKELLI